MKIIKAFIRSHPLLSYYALVFAISWGGVLMVVGPGGIPATNKEQYDTLFPIAILAMVAGPSVAGILAPLATATATEADDLRKGWPHHLFYTDVGRPSGVGGVAHGVTPWWMRSDNWRYRL
jgi:hypothetical protein